MDRANNAHRKPENEEEEEAKAPTVPAGFLSATYHAGDYRKIHLRLDPTRLPEDWSVEGCGRDEREILNSATWRTNGCPKTADIAWEPAQPPEKLLVQWDNQEAFLPINVEDSRSLPPPAQLKAMSADQMLWILAATDPSAAFRAWARDQQPVELFDDDLDSATPADLDPLRRYDLQTTFLHRVRRRAHVLAQLRANLQRPVTGKQALEWRLRGLIGIEPLAERLARELAQSNGAGDEALLTLADFMIVLREVHYQPEDGFLPRAAFEEIYRPFVRELGNKLAAAVEPHRARVSAEMMNFWERVMERCQA